ncbi:4193_t:CDS:2, partial [Funneliformis geosporum]
MLTSEQRAQAIILLKNGFASRKIAAKVGCKSYTTISRLKKKYEETGKIENKPGSGRPRKLNERDKCSLIRRLMTKECTTAVQLQKSLKTSNNIEVSTNTIRRALKRNGL